MTIKFDLLRPDDLLNLRIEGENLQLDIAPHDKAALVPENPEKPAYLIITFPPQTIIEEAFYEASQTKPPPEEEKKDPSYNDPPKFKLITSPKVPVRARIGRPSRLVLRIPPGSNLRIPLTTQGLLDWDQFELSVSPLADVPPNPTSAQRQKAPGIKEPGRLETAIELPYRLILSPNHAVAWQHAATPKTHRGITELWHTRLALKIAQRTILELSRSQRAPLRAIWSPDYNPAKFYSKDPPEFGEPDEDWDRDKDKKTGGVLTAMTPSDRHEIVVLTSAFHGYIKDMDDYSSFVPSPVYAEQLILSPLGGWLKSRGDWDPPVPFKPYSIIRRVDYRAKWERILKDIATLGPLEDIQPESEAVFPEELTFTFHADDPPVPVNLPAPPPVKDLQFVRLGMIDIGAVLWPRLLGEKSDSPLNMSEWTHLATQGRDHFVRIVYEGHLYPFGHRASLIKITERKIRDDVPLPDGSTTPLAYLVQRMFIVVRQPLRDYTSAEFAPLLENGGRGLPFKNIRLTTLITPDIARLEDGSQITGTTYSFWIRLGKGASPDDDFKFHAIAEDIAGNQVNFTASLIFVPFGEGHRDLVPPVYKASDEARACLVSGQKVTYAPAAGADNENTSLTTSALYFATHAVPFNKRTGGFMPKLFKANVNLPAVEAMLGKPAETQIEYYKGYLSADPGNKTGLFARIVEEVPSGVEGVSSGVLAEAKLLSEFSADQAGGFATPNLSISGLTSQFGPLAGDLANAAGDIFDPSDFFKDVGDAAKLFGSLKLADLLEPLTMGAGAPKVQFDKKEVTPKKWKLIATLDWTPKVGSLELDIISFHPKKGGTDAKLLVKGRVEKIVEIPPSGTPDPGSAKMEGSLTDFTIELLHIVEVLFNRFAFTAETGKKLDVTVELDPETPVRFLKDLQFVEELRKRIPPDLFGEGPSLDINATRVKAGFSIALPPVSVGVFSLRDVVLAAFLELPFLDGRPLFDFSFSSRERPFNLTVSFLGGGGFFHLQLDTLGLRMLEAALEFGASASIDLGVASGGVYIMAGIYFSVQRREIGGVEVDAATLAGYLRMGGELSVLGLISVSLEFYLTFAYQDVREAYGRATLTVKVEVLFFSKSVEITVEKRFGGSSGDPYFLDTFDPAVWNEYAGAFA